MITTVMPEADLLSDEQLVGLTLDGDREAFGQIVARYQSPICALAYSACGSISRSEDLAQEVFVAAWRKLGELKNPAKLKAWLYAIARNLICTAFRQQSRNPLASADPLDDALESDAQFCAPSDEAITKEEETILWHVLAGLPEIYREPMVLFYRQEESIANVAEILGLSEDAVRQRLSRGRSMLNERVAKVVEIGLRRSGPSKAFALTVLAALPVASVKAGTVGAATTAAAKGSTVLGGVPIVSAIGSALSSVVSVLAGLIGLWGRIQNTCSVRERRFAARTVYGLLAWALVFIVVNRYMFGHGVLRMSAESFDVVALSVYWMAVLGPLLGFSIWRDRGQRRIQLEEGTAQSASPWWLWRLDPTHRGFRTAVNGTLACLFFGGAGLLIFKAAAVSDTTVLGALLGFCVVGCLLSDAKIVRHSEKTPRIFIAIWWTLALVNLLVVNLRWDSWFGGIHALEISRHAAPWTVDYLILFFFGMGRSAWWLRRRFMALSDARAATGWAIGAYLGLLLCGSAVLSFMR